MESHPIPGKHLSVEECAVVDKEMEASPQNSRRMCNELVHELCEEIPVLKTSERILLTSLNLYAYLASRFRKKLIYRGAIAFIKTTLKSKKNVQIWIDPVVQNNESEPIVVQINQKLSNREFKFETNHFCFYIWNENDNRNLIIINDGQFVNAHFLYFLRLIAPLLQPIQLSLWSLRIPIAAQVRFLNAESDWIDSIRLLDYHFDSEPIYGALSKYNKLEIHSLLSPVNVPKIIHWLTNNNNNNGQPKKYLFLRQGLNDGLALLMEELKKEFASATSKRRFVVRLVLLGQQQLDEFTVCNELTGEMLQLRRHVGDGEFYALSRSPNIGLENDENDSAKLYFTEMYEW